MLPVQWISGYYWSSLAAWAGIATWQSWAAFHKRSSASKKLVFKIQVIWNPHTQMDGLPFFSPHILSVKWRMHAVEYIMPAINHCAVVYAGVTFRDQRALSFSVLSWTHYGTERWHLFELSQCDNYTIITANSQLLYLKGARKKLLNIKR